MHIHVHNEIGGVDRPIGPEDMSAAGIVGHEVTFGTTAAEYLAQAPTMEALVSPPWLIRRLDLFAAPRLRLVQSTSAGVERLWPFDKIPANVLLTNNRGTHAAKAGEYAVMAILTLVNRMPAIATNQRERVWDRIVSGLAADHRLTIVGLGSLGGAAAKQAKRLGMHITGIRHGETPHPDCDRTLTMAGLDKVLPETDILLLACPLTPETRHMLSAARIAALPPGAGVINIGRGGLVEEAALFDALDEGRLAGAVLDVFDREPLPKDHRAWAVKNLIITPHMSSDNPATYNADTLRIFARNLAAYLAGDVPPTLVDQKKGY
jgi:phosphoglycerate dehydrogenase-like enzyme